MADSELRESERSMEALKSDATEYTIASEQPKRGKKVSLMGRCVKKVDSQSWKEKWQKREP